MSADSTPEQPEPSPSTPHNRWARHRWESTESVYAGHGVQRCRHCRTERVRDTLTATLYLYRRGGAKVPGKPLGEDWRGFVAGMLPVCRPVAESQQ